MRLSQPRLTILTTSPSDVNTFLKSFLKYFRQHRYMLGGIMGLGLGESLKSLRIHLRARVKEEKSSTNTPDYSPRTMYISQALFT